MRGPDSVVPVKRSFLCLCLPTEFLLLSELVTVLGAAISLLRYSNKGLGRGQPFQVGTSLSATDTWAGFFQMG